MPRIVVAATEIVAEAPGSGFVPPFSADTALALAQAALADTEAAARACGSSVTVLLDGTSPLTTELPVVRSPLDGEDQRLASVLVGDDGPVLIVRSRTPQVTPELLTDLLATLDGPYGDAVVGLTVDESWWALGLARPDPTVLVGVPARGETSGRHLLDRLHGLGLAVGLAERLLAAETHDDVREVAAQAGPGRFSTEVASLG